jgi:ABC-type tungstate transport system substrate-binding protein
MNKLAVAALAALAIALQAAFLHAVVALPLASAVGYAQEPARPTFEESILVRAVAKSPRAVPVVHVKG